MKAERLREVAGCGVACGSGSSFACEGCIWVCLLRLVLGCLCVGGGGAGEVCVFADSEEGCRV